jgi:lambda repressor-like predicted transcriptional regulator
VLDNVFHDRIHLVSLMETAYTEAEVIAAIRKRTDASSVRQIAREVGVSPGYLSLVLVGKKPVSDTIAELFGFRREVVTEIRFKAS